MTNKIHCTVSYTKPHRHFIDIQIKFPTNNKEEIPLHLPTWRPGRYEKTNYARCIKNIHFADENGQILNGKKSSTNTWIVNSLDCKTVVVSYTFYADTINAGASYLDENILYINPVNCFLFIPEYTDYTYKIELSIPDDFKIATGLTKTDDKTLVANNYQMLFDSPILCTNQLSQFNYQVNEIPFHIHIYGNIHFDIEKMLEEFIGFTKSQIEAFGSFPEKEYHFIFLLLDVASYHGVEHENSTVITLGPAKKLATRDFYKELQGVSCHELYHTWNIKKIRPKALTPYDFTQENYTALGYVAEGVTTYMGDHFLWRSGAYDTNDYMIELSTVMQRHFDNPGRLNLPVSQSSFDTWVDGYEVGIPWRKVSIYNEGAIISMLLDINIVKNSDGKKSLDDVMKKLWNDVNTEYTGYTEEDYLQAVNEVSETDFRWFFEKYVWNASDFNSEIKTHFNDVGLQLVKNTPANVSGLLGIKINATNVIISILPNSPADKAKMWIGDKIIKLNQEPISDLNKEISKYENTTARIDFERMGKHRRTEASLTKENTYSIWTVKQLDTPSESQQKMFTDWRRN